MSNTLAIQQYDEQIAVLTAKVRHLEELDRASAHPSLYVCTRCGMLYQSPWGCGCPAAASGLSPSAGDKTGEVMSGVSGGDPTRAMAERRTILRVPAGSTLHGLHLPGKDDRDEVGICIEDREHVVGFSPFEQYIYRTAAEREGKHDAPSQPGDLDLTIFSLRKFLRLAMQGNPQIIQCLFVPWELCLIRDGLGQSLQQDIAPLIISRQAGARYLGYLEAQRQRLMGERGQKKVNRPELEAKYGFDTKYAMHILRLGFQGVELLSTGKLTLPMPEKDRAFTYATRLGEVPLQDVLTKAGELERDIKDLASDGPLMPEPAREEIEAWMVERYWECWKARQTSTTHFESDLRALNGQP